MELNWQHGYRVLRQDSRTRPGETLSVGVVRCAPKDPATDEDREASTRAFGIATNSQGGMVQLALMKHYAKANDGIPEHERHPTTLKQLKLANGLQPKGRWYVDVNLWDKVFWAPDVALYLTARMGAIMGVSPVVGVTRTGQVAGIVTTFHTGRKVLWPRAAV